jgi:PHP family Zn ribbon phosphoesterase
MRVREGKVHIEAGYDGLFGKIEIFSKEERLRMSSKHQQSMLF